MAYRGMFFLCYYRKSCKGDKSCKCGCLVCRSFFLVISKIPLYTDGILPIQIASIRIGLSIICFEGSQVDFPNKYVLLSLNIAFIMANSADTDEMQHHAAFYLRFISLFAKLPFRVSQYTKG